MIPPYLLLTKGKLFYFIYVVLVESSIKKFHLLSLLTLQPPVSIYYLSYRRLFFFKLDKGLLKESQRYLRTEKSIL